MLLPLRNRHPGSFLGHHTRPYSVNDWNHPGHPPEKKVPTLLKRVGTFSCCLLDAGDAKEAGEETGSQVPWSGNQSLPAAEALAV